MRLIHFYLAARPIWTGKQIIELGGGWDDQPDVGADVARNPLPNRDRPLILNQTDAQRCRSFGDIASSPISPMK